MRIAVSVALLALVAAAPAAATQGLRCAPVSGSGPVLSLVIGSAAGPAIAGATLADTTSTRSTMGENAALAIGQAWIDAQRVWLDLTDAAAQRYEAKLRATFNPRLRGRPATGTLTRNGRSWAVRCIES